MKLHKHHYLYIFVTFMFIGISAVELFSEGMFLDGLLYASISRNMAEGLGSFWKPHLTNALSPEFYGHPPLALGIQSIFFKLFGDSIYVERLYSLFTYIVVGYLIVLIWEILTTEKKYGWIPLLFWSITGGIYWSLANNILENTLSIFVLLSFLFYLKNIKEERFYWILLSGISLSLGLLTKGFVCLYLWGVPFFYWLFKRKGSFLQMTNNTVDLILYTVLPIAILFFIFPDAQNNMINYFDKQVLGSFNDVQTVDTRFEIVGIFFGSIAASVLIGIITILIALTMKVQKSLLILNLKDFLMFTVIALSGVIPIIASLKQRHFYIITVYPIFALGLAYYIYPILKIAITKIKLTSIGFKAFKGITIAVIIISTALTISQINRVGRDKDIIYDVKKIINVIGKDNTVNICRNMHSEWHLHAYFARYGNVSLDYKSNNVCQYYLSNGKCNKDILENKYDIVPIETKKYKLYKLK